LSFRTRASIREAEVGMVGLGYVRRWRWRGAQSDEKPVMIRQPEPVLVDAGQRHQVERLDGGAGEQVVDLPVDPARVVGRGAGEPQRHDALE